MYRVMQINNIFSGYSDNEILHGVSFAAAKGELIGIIGPNGCGKTTLLRTLTGILKPSHGEILIEDKKLSKLSHRHIAKNIAVVTQSIDPVAMTVYDYVLMGRFPYHSRFQFFDRKDDYELAEKYMKLTDVYTLKDKFMSEISGGERQRAQVARALVQQPLILLLDEPTSHLDITHQIKILDLIKRLNRELKLTVIMVIHDLNMAAEYCSRLLMVKDGIVYKEGEPHEVLTYSDIENVYSTVVLVEKNPITKRPFVIPVTEEMKDRGRDQAGYAE